jgi:hypothetical protein
VKASVRLTLGSHNTNFELVVFNEIPGGKRAGCAVSRWSRAERGRTPSLFMAWVGVGGRCEASVRWVGGRLVKGVNERGEEDGVGLERSTERETSQVDDRGGGKWTTAKEVEIVLLGGRGGGWNVC